MKYVSRIDKEGLRNTQYSLDNAKKKMDAYIYISILYELG